MARIEYVPGFMFDAAMTRQSISWLVLSLDPTSLPLLVSFSSWVDPLAFLTSPLQPLHDQLVTSHAPRLSILDYE
jgi:hypothetical protein